jgi:PAS domain S-box-containing protein
MTDDEAPADTRQFPEYAVVALGPAGEVTTWTDAAERLTGFPRDSVVGRPPLNLLAEAGRSEFEQWLDQARREGSAEIANWLRRASGDRFLAGLTLTAVPAGDQVAGFAMTIADLTFERELRQSHAMFEGILAIASDAVVCIDESHRIVFFNQGAEKMFGHRASEALGQPLQLLIPPQFRPGHAEQIEKFGRSPVAARQMGERGTIAGLRKSGEVFPAEASISKLGVGASIIFTAVLRDVTERRAAEEALARQAAELTRSNRELEQFAYVASHDLQEPLRMVASYTQLLGRRYGAKLDDDAREFISFAVDGVTRMQALINDLLAYSRAGTREAPFEVVEAEAVLDRVLATLEPTIMEAGATVVRQQLPTVLADPVQLGQVLQNLVQNAIKFRRPEVSPVVRISAEPVGGEWVFTIADNGIGIAPEFRARIFSLFQRLHSRDEYPGTGIGLSICQKIVERHGGRIWVEGTPGEGSIFRFTLPQRVDDKENDA